MLQEVCFCLVVCEVMKSNGGFRMLKMEFQRHPRLCQHWTGQSMVWRKKMSVAGPYSMFEKNLLEIKMENLLCKTIAL